MVSCGGKQPKIVWTAIKIFICKSYDVILSFVKKLAAFRAPKKISAPRKSSRGGLTPTPPLLPFL